MVNLNYEVFLFCCFCNKNVVKFKFLGVVILILLLWLVISLIGCLVYLIVDVLLVIVILFWRVFDSVLVSNL